MVEEPDAISDHPAAPDAPNARLGQVRPAPAAETEPPLAERAKSVAKKAGVALGALIVAIVAYFILAAFLPRWWAQQMARVVDHSFGRGIATGLLLGLVCTLVPLVLLALAVLARHRMKQVPSYVLAALAVAFAIPNLLTLSIVIGTGNGAHAGERTLDVGAPGFRGATLWGVIIGAVIGLVTMYFIWRYRSRGRKIAEAKQALENSDKSA